MRTVKKLGLAGLIISALAGCGSVKIADEIETLKSLRRDGTSKNVKKFSQEFKKIEQNAVQDYTLHALDEESKDMKLLDAAEAERNKLVKLRDDFYNSLREMKGLPSKKQTTNESEKNNSTEVYGLSEETSTNPYNFSGLGIRYERGGRFYSAVGGELGNMEKTVRGPTSQTDYSGNQQELYGVVGIRLVNTKPFKLNLGLRGMYRCQEDVIETSDVLGDFTTKDTTSIPGLGLEASAQVGRFIIRAGHGWYLGGEGSHEDLETTKFEAGFTF